MRRPCLIVTHCSILVITIILISCTRGTSETSAGLPTGLDEIENLVVFPAEMEAKADMRFERERSFGDMPERPIGHLGGIAIDNLGRLYLNDALQNTIRIYKPEGAYLTSIGRSGNGPREYSVGPFPTIKNNQLFLSDLKSSKLDQYSTDNFDFIRTIIIKPVNISSFDELSEAMLNQLYVINEKKLLVRLSTFNMRPPDDAGELKDDQLMYFYLMNDEGRLSGPIMEPVTRYEITGRSTPKMESAFGPYTRAVPRPYLFTRPLITVSDKGEIYTALSNQLLIRKYTAEGVYQSAIYHHFDHLIMNRDDAINSQFTPVLADLVSQNELPEVWPSMDKMLVDEEDRIWIATIVENLSIHEWWVLDQNGELITKFEWPRDEPIEIVKNGKMYTRETDVETGLERVVRYGIEMEPLQ